MQLLNSRIGKLLYSYKSDISTPVEYKGSSEVRTLCRPLPSQALSSYAPICFSTARFASFPLLKTLLSIILSHAVFPYTSLPIFTVSPPKPAISSDKIASVSASWAAI